MKTDREKQLLSGHVRAVRSETKHIKEQDGRTVEEPWFGHAVTFNKEGYALELVNINADGGEWRAVNDYSDSGRMLATHHYDPSGALCAETRYVYDEEGRLRAEQYVNGKGEIATRATYAYDAEGRKIKTEELDMPGEANLLIGIEGTSSSIGVRDAKRVETRYDERGEAVEVKLFNADGALLSRMEIKRDERGCPLEEIQFVGETFPFGACSTESCTTAEGIELSEEQKAEAAAEIARLFSPGTALSKHTHRYDEEGRLIESRLTMMEMDAGHQSFAYDEFGNKSEEVSYSEDGTFGSKAIFKREYDEHGNWTREVVSSASSWDAEFNLSTPIHVTRRVITYY